MPHFVEYTDLTGWQNKNLFASSSNEQKRLYITFECFINSVQAQYEVFHKDISILKTVNLQEAVDKYNSITN